MADALPEWAEDWLTATCGCGSRTVRVVDMTGQEQTVCAESGWSVERCPAALSATDTGEGTGLVTPGVVSEDPRPDWTAATAEPLRTPDDLLPPEGTADAGTTTSEGNHHGKPPTN